MMKLTLTLFSSAGGNRPRQPIMLIKLCIIISMITSEHYAFAGEHSVNTQISIRAYMTELKEVLREIEKNSDYVFSFSDQLSELGKKVSIIASGSDINTVMPALLANTNLEYQVLDNNTVVIKAKILQQEIVIKGKVVDAEGSGLPGAKVAIKGTEKAVVTDVDGIFSITVPNPESVLIISSVGFNDEEIVVGAQTNINVTLIETLEELNEVVVVGYGSMERTNVTGAISSIKTDDLSKAAVPNLVEAMRGQIPGVSVKRMDGMPGSKVEFQIRGESSLNSSNEPLIVIDGVPMTGGNIAEFNANDIESINVLKDAAAASIYGARGANGVILITTKEGRSGKPVLNVSFSQGFTNLANKPDLMNAEEFVQLKMDAAEGAGQPNSLEDVLTDAVEYGNYTNPDGIKEIDWHDVLLRVGKITQAGLSLSGGTDKITFYMNGDAYRENGIVQHTSYNRYSLRLNSDYRPYRFLKTGVKVQLTKTTSDETGNSAVIYSSAPDFTDFLGNTPLGRMYDENNELVPTVKGDQFDYNPLWKYRESQTDRYTSRILLSPYLEITILKDLVYRINSSVELRDEKYGRFTSSLYDLSTIDGVPGRNKLTFIQDGAATYLLDNILSYNKVLAEKHSLNATMVFGIQTYTFDSLRVYGEGSATDLLSYYSLFSSEQDFKVIEPKTDEWANMYYALRLGYSYDRRYNFTFTGRYDGSSKFGPDMRWGFFPSMSFAWNIDEESFLENVNPVSLLKYRISWGRMGNDQIPAYGYVSLTSDVSYPFSQVIYTGFTADKLENTNLQWETSQQFNTGLDFGLFKNRLYGTVDVYRINTIDLILDQQIPSVTGFTTVVSNVGETKNQGIEVSLNYRILDGDFKWEIGANWFRDKNEIVHLNGELDEEGNEVDDLANEWFIGEDIHEIYDFDYIGVWQSGEEEQAAAMHPDKPNYGAGDPKIRDVDGNDTINFEDQTFLGNPTPDWSGGLKNTFSYKGIELSILFEAVQGVTRINNFYGNLTSRGNEIKVDYWTPDNPTNEFPQPNIQSPYYYIDAVRVRDASFIALRNVSLSYTLPSQLSEKFKVSHLQVYIRGNNLKYFTKYEGYSPETRLGAFPITKNWTIGANITF